MKKQLKSGFTMVELMLVSAIAAILFGAAAYFLAQTYRQHLDSLNFQMTMDEIRVFQAVLNKNAHSKTTASPAVNRLDCFNAGGSRASFTYEASDHSIIYDPDDSVAGNEIVILKDAAISGFTSQITNDAVSSNLLVSLTIELAEKGMGNMVKTNDFVFYVYMRNREG
ncbi:MAG: prepilin-type N-terminal cleavage/methylation domain-containing protein [Pontiellaceae bacterium]|jgi:prepilin-type N-terminal cleavage/methylation domain-containing protein|nr:prepilin-type N-terminal cleavage/methylation domain-containing protein [Pontiellaceae bacterium]